MSYCQGCADKDTALASLRASHQEVIRVVRELLETPGLRFHMSHCATNEFGTGVSRVGAECNCDLGANVAAVRKALSFPVEEAP